MAVDYDVIIVGGGMVGASLACAMKDLPLSIAMIEAYPPPQGENPSFDERTIVLNYSSYKVYQALGLWAEIWQSRQASPIVDIKISEVGHEGKMHLSHLDMATESLGYVVPTRVLGQALYQSLTAHPKIETFCPATAIDATIDANTATVTIDCEGTQRRLRASLLVMADGGRSKVRENLGFVAHEKSYSQHLLVTSIDSDTAHRGRAHERFTHAGPIALLPRAKCQYALLWTLDEAEVENYLNMDDESFLAKLSAVYGEQLGQLTRVGKRKSYPLKTAWVSKPVSERVVLLGNAAHTVHPVGAQGFNLGLKEAATLAELLRDGCDRRVDIGGGALLAAYQQKTRGEAQFVVSFTEQLLKLFANQSALMNTVRSLGMRAFDKLLPLKQELLKHTLGLGEQSGSLRSGHALVGQKRARLTESFDIVIVGAGLMGATLAKLLAKTNYRVALLDKAPAPEKPKQKFDLRINAYNLASESLLKALGIWQQLPKDRIFPFAAMAVCNGGSNALVNFDAKDVDESHLGHFIENNLVNRTALDSLSGEDNIRYITGLEITDIEDQGQHLRLNTRGGVAYSAKLVLACDGANSRMRQMAGIAVECLPYHQKCIVATVRFDGSHRQTAWQRFLPTGPLGLLSLEDGYCSLAWSCEKGRAEELLAMNDETFLNELRHACGDWFGNEIIGIGPRAAFPLLARHAKQYTSHRLALLGDAAHAIHPLAGLGANIGFQDVMCLSEILQQAEAARVDIGSERLLHRYQRRRRSHNAQVMHMMTAFNTVFSRESRLLNPIHHLGFSLADKLTPVKRLLLKQAVWMGQE